MSKHTDQASSQPGAVPVQIALEDFIEAVTRGAGRAWAAQDDVGGYGGDAAAQFSHGFGLVIYCRPPSPLDPRFPLGNAVKKGD